MQIPNHAVSIAPTARSVIIAVLFKKLRGGYRSEEHWNHGADDFGNKKRGLNDRLHSLSRQAVKAIAVDFIVAHPEASSLNVLSSFNDVTEFDVLAVETEKDVVIYVFNRQID